MPPITPVQIRGARAMLGWSMADLAQAAGVSVSTVKRFEDSSRIAVSPDIATTMQLALERAGVHFLQDDGDGPGVRIKPL